MKGSVNKHVRQAVPAYVILAAILVAVSIVSPSFRKVGNIRNVIAQCAVLAIVAIAQTNVLLIGGIDMSVSSVISFSTIAVAMFSQSSGLSLLGSIALALAAGAATVGCCCQMVGFAVASYRENGVGGLVAQGVGTSMLQVSNILRHPLILVPPTLASALLGPLATTLFDMRNTGIFAGMGTAGFVGQIGTWNAMAAAQGALPTALKMLALHIVLPAVVTLLISEGMRKAGLIKHGDMKLEL